MSLGACQTNRIRRRRCTSACPLPKQTIDTTTVAARPFQQLLPSVTRGFLCEGWTTSNHNTTTQTTKPLLKHQRPLLMLPEVAFHLGISSCSTKNWAPSNITLISSLESPAVLAQLLLFRLVAGYIFCHHNMWPVNDRKPCTRDRINLDRDGTGEAYWHAGVTIVVTTTLRYLQNLKALRAFIC